MDYLIHFFHGAATVVDIAAMLLLTVGFVRGAAGWLVQEVKRPPWEERVIRLGKLRCVVGLHILFALELMIVSDLIETVLIIMEHAPHKGSFFSSPVFFELSQLAVVVIIRTFIDFFLSREIKEIKAMGDSSSSEG